MRLLCNFSPENKVLVVIFKFRLSSANLLAFNRLTALHTSSIYWQRSTFDTYDLSSQVKMSLFPDIQEPPKSGTYIRVIAWPTPCPPWPKNRARSSPVSPAGQNQAPKTVCDDTPSLLRPRLARDAVHGTLSSPLRPKAPPAFWNRTP